MTKNISAVERDNSDDITESVKSLLPNKDVSDNSLKKSSPGTSDVTGDSSATEEERPVWNSKLQYILTQVGFSVGLGNVWRFPYLCQKNGGGAYLVPYLILLGVIGIPLFFLELAVGQRIRRGSIGAWNCMSPWLGGIGFASCMVCFFVALYYNVIIGWSLYYLFSSFQDPLPWHQCPLVNNRTDTYVEPECEGSSATTYYWYREALNITSSISESSSLNWKMAVCLLVAWTIVCFAMIKGIQSSGKVMYFCSLFPYLVLFCFLLRTLLLNGSVDGIRHMFTPKRCMQSLIQTFHSRVQVEIMLDPKVWREAATQVFFALGLGSGGVIAFSSYNKRDNNCHADAVLVSLINVFTSVLATVVVFAVLGFKANIMNAKCIQLNTEKIVGLLGNEIKHSLIPQHINFSYISSEDYTEMTNVIKGTMKEEYSKLGLDSCNIEDELGKTAQGTGLAFITFTEAMTHFPVSPFWSIMFFLMLVSLGLGSMIGVVQGVITPMVDTLKVRKELITVVFCLLAFAIGLIFVQRSGSYFVAMFDDYSATLPLLVVVLLENVAVAWVYGTDKFFKDLKDMLGFSPLRFYYYMWKYITPLALFALLLASVIQLGMTPPAYSAWIQELAQEKTLRYPNWCIAMCIVLVGAAILPVPVVLALRYFCIQGNKSHSLSNRYYQKAQIIVEEDTSLSQVKLPIRDLKTQSVFKCERHPQ